MRNHAPVICKCGTGLMNEPQPNQCHVGGRRGLRKDSEIPTPPLLREVHAAEEEGLMPLIYLIPAFLAAAGESDSLQRVFVALENVAL